MKVRLEVSNIICASRFEVSKLLVPFVVKVSYPCLLINVNSSVSRTLCCEGHLSLFVNKC